MRTLFILFLIATLGACASDPLVKKDRSHFSRDEKIATDAVDQLMRIYSPAKTQFNVIESTPVDFGALLVQKLRAKGYAVAEFKLRTKDIGAVFENDSFGATYPTKPADQAAEMPRVPAWRSPGIELRYVLVHSRAPDFSRITLKIGNSLLARAYLTDNVSIAPAGVWIFEE